MSVSTLLGAMASSNDTIVVEAVSGETQMPARKEAGILLQAAAMAAEFDGSPRSASSDIDHVLEDDRGLLVKAWQAVSDRDVVADLYAVREEIERKDQDMVDKVNCGSVETSDPVSDLDALIPF